VTTARGAPTRCTETERILSFPVSIESNKYERNALIFNLGLVFALEDDDLRSYEPVVRKLAKVFRTLEVRPARGCWCTAVAPPG